MGRQHTGQVGRFPRRGNDDAKAVIPGGFRELRRRVRRPVGRHDPHFHRDAKALQPLNGRGHGGEVAVAAHNDCYLFAHS